MRLLIVLFTRVAFPGMDYDHQELGMEPRHAWWTRHCTGDRRWMIIGGYLCGSCRN